ncbi:MAG: PD-(D/E)XK nuclease family protein [Ruminococcus sp.]|nr:PD-(D/E)XK nuclease family protein [Ruminococcus sp.]
MLRFVLGRCGTGKSEYLKNYLAALAKAGEEKLLFIVPDQKSFETEAAFLSLLGPSLAGNIMVLGFSRLCDYVFEHIGSRFASFADEGVRHVVMSLALEEVAPSLSLFSKRASKLDLCELMLSAVKEYKQCGISAGMLEETARRSNNETLSKKLSESALVYEAYNALMEKSYLDPLDSLTKAADAIRKHQLFAGFTVAVDSFYGFTAQEYALLEQLMTQSKDMLISLCMEADDTGNTDVFNTLKKTRRKLSAIAKDSGVSVAAPVRLDERFRFENNELKAVEENLYRYHKIPYKKNTDYITRYTARDIYDECDFVGRNIKKLVEEGYRYRDIAILSRSTDKYAGVLSTALQKYDISYFMDEPYPIDSFPLVRLINAVFLCATRGFDRDDVLGVLKSGLTVYSVENIADFENYLYIWDISGAKFYAPFAANPRGFADEFTDKDRETLERIETLRSDIIGKLRRFCNAVKDTDALSVAKALMQLLYALKVQENIDALCDRFEEKDRADLSAELIRLWNVLCDILDKMIAVVGSYRMNPKKFYELLHIYFSNTELSSIPRGVDQVDVALADRAELSDKKAVFVIGAVEDEFPHNPVEAGVFTDSERLELIAMQLPMSDSVAELLDTEKYYVYRALTCATDRLYVSYPAMSLSSEKLSPSSVMSELAQIFPNTHPQSALEQGVSEHLYSKKAAFEYYISRYRSGGEELASLRAFFEDDPDYRGALSSIRSAERREPRHIRDKALSKALFSKNHFLSSSQVDKYHLCRFEYFCRYGLSVKERRKASIDALEYGTLMHYVMENFFKNHQDDDFSAIEKSKAEAEVSALLDEYIEKHLGGKEGKDKRFLYLFYRIRKTASDLVWRIVTELSQSSFRPSDFELSIGEEIPAYTVTLNNGEKIRIRGSVDRVDTYEKDGVEYIRVIDYKTGKKEFRLSDILYGLNLQMLIYLSAINSNGREKYGENLSPAGVLYMPAVSPKASDSDAKDEEGLKKKLLSQYTMHGIVLEDKEVLSAMEKDLKGSFIPVSLKGDELKGGESLASVEQLGALFRQIDILIADMAQSLYEGEIDALPSKGSGFDACRWCSYLSVCTHRESDGVRDIVKMNKEEVYETLQREEGEDETVDGSPA